MDDELKQQLSDIKHNQGLLLEGVCKTNLLLATLIINSTKVEEKDITKLMEKFERLMQPATTQEETPQGGAE